MKTFKLSQSFLNEYANENVKWGYGALSYVTYKRTYARDVDGSRTEEWHETCQRVIEGMFTLQKRHCRNTGLTWNNRKAQRSAQEAYKRMFEFKWLPPGRGLWMMGTDFVYERGSAALNNCGFTSTEGIDVDFAKPFTWCFEMSMYGVGVGFDTKGAKKNVIIQKPETKGVFVVEDSREGWTEALDKLLNAFVGNGYLPEEWDVSNVRAKGEPIKGFGGVSSGPEPLLIMIGELTGVLNEFIGKPVTSVLITDIMNIAGKCVVAGGIRRTAEIAFGAWDDEDFMKMKDKSQSEKVQAWRWASNNSIFPIIGMDYSKPAKSTAQNGEPGYAWLKNMQDYGRMCEPKNYVDRRVKGGNPCLEQSLEHLELCCLVETFPAKHESFDDFKKTLKYAYMYAKTVTLVPTHDPLTNAVMMRNRRIGCSMSGIAQNVDKLGLSEHINWLNNGYDLIKKLDVSYSEWLCVPVSIKNTSVKPSGTVSLLAGATPGVHRAESKFYIRRINIHETSPIWKACEEVGYHVEDSYYQPMSKVVSFPIAEQNCHKTVGDTTMWEQLEMAAIHQAFWADNQVSCTVKFKKEEADDIKTALEMYQYRLKGISFLPVSEHGYRQAPYEPISEEEYLKMVECIKGDLDIGESYHEADDKFCDGDACMI